MGTRGDYERRDPYRDPVATVSGRMPAMICKDGCPSRPCAREQPRAALLQPWGAMTGGGLEGRRLRSRRPGGCWSGLKDPRLQL